MNKATMIETLSDRLGGRRTATEAVDAVIDTITRAVASGERVAITGFGVFERVARPARTGRNPRTGASVKIKKTTVPKFKAGQHFKDVVSGAKKVAKSAPSSGAAKSTTTKSTATKSTATKSAAKKAPAKSAAKSTAKAPAKSAAKSAAKKAPAKSTAKKSTTKATSKAPASKAASTRKSAAGSAKKSATKRTAKR